MKKIFKTLAIVAVAALGFACQNEIDEQVNGNEGEKVTVEVVGSVADLTRSVFGAPPTTQEGTVSSTWTKDQTVYFAPYQPESGNIAMSEATVAESGAEASFEVEFTNTQDEGTIHAFSPKGVQNGAGGFTSSSIYSSAYMYLNVPAKQTTSATSCDEQVHVLYASKEYSGGFPTSVSMAFNHVLAYGKMNITNFAGGEIASVAVTFPEAVAGGSVKYYYLTNTFTDASAKTITVNNVDDNATIWFGIVPTESGEEKMSGNMTVVVTDAEGKTYTKELATKDKLAFKQGQVSNFTVNMSGIAAEIFEVVPVGEGVSEGETNKQDDTLSWTYGENDNFTTTIVKSSAQTQPREDADGQLRMYKGNELTFTAVEGSIVKIEMTVTEVENNTLTADKGALAYKNGVITWTGQAKEVEFTTSAKIFMNPIKVYYSDEDPIVATALATPEILAEVQNTTEVYVIWSDVENAVNYTVTCGGQTQTIAAGVEEATFTGLSYSTNYTVSVTANPEVGSLYYAASEAATTTVTTGADSANYSGKYLIVAQKDGKYYYMSTWKDGQSAITGGNNRTAVDSGVATITDYTSEADFAETFDTKYVWTIASVDGGYTIANSDSSAWLYLGEDQNRAKMTTNESQKETFTISKEDNVYTIKATSYTRTLALNKDNNNSLFNCYASGDYVYDLVLIPYTGSVKVKEASSLSFSQTEFEVDLNGFDGTFKAPTETLTPADGTLTYSSSKPEVATVDAATGDVEIIGVGTTVITATFAGNAEYKGCSASYTIEVINSAAGGKEKTMTIDTSHFNSTSYDANNNSKDIEGITVTSYQVMYQNSCMQWQKSKGYIYNNTNMGKIKSIEFVGVTGGTFSVIGDKDANSSDGTSIGSVTKDGTLDVAAKGDFSYFYIKVGSATGKCQSIKVTYVK